MLSIVSGITVEVATVWDGLGGMASLKEVHDWWHTLRVRSEGTPVHSDLCLWLRMRG